MLSWNYNNAECLKIIKSNKSKFKILLKTKNEGAMLSNWIEWHASICSDTSIFIFDNLSTNEETLRIYDKYRNINIFSFNGFHNDLHRPACVPGLYESIRESTRNFIFLDTDERLACLNEDCSSLASNNTIAGKISEMGSTTLPTIWINNSAGLADTFILNKNYEHFKSGLSGGKPIINCSEPFSEMMNHNFQLKNKFSNKKENYRFIIFHLKNLDPAQRINSNINKLIAYNAFKSFKNTTPTLIDILNLDISIFPPGNKRNWINEIHKLAADIKSLDRSIHKSLPRWHFKVLANGSIIFGSGELENYFKECFSGSIAN